MRTIQPSPHARGTATFSLGVIEGIGRNLTAMKRDGHSNPSAHSYDRAGAVRNTMTRLAFAGDVVFFRKSTGWYTVQTSDGTYTFAPNARVFWASAGEPYSHFPVMTSLRDLAEFGTD